MKSAIKCITYIHPKLIEVSKSQSGKIYEVVNIKHTVLGALDTGLILLDFVTIYTRLRNKGFRAISTPFTHNV